MLSGLAVDTHARGIGWLFHHSLVEHSGAVKKMFLYLELLYVVVVEVVRFGESACEHLAPRSEKPTKKYQHWVILSHLQRNSISR